MSSVSWPGGGGGGAAMPGGGGGAAVNAHAIVQQLAVLDPANTWKGLEWWKRWSEACARVQKWVER